MSTQPIRQKIEKLKLLIDSELSSISPPGDIDKTTWEKYAKLVSKMDLMDEILDDLSVIVKCKDKAQNEGPMEEARRDLSAVFADGFVTLRSHTVLKTGGIIWESRPSVKKYPLAPGCDVEELKTQLAQLGVQTIDPDPDAEAVDAVPMGDGQ